MPDQVGHDKGRVGHDEGGVGHDENRHCRPALPVIAGPDRQSLPCPQQKMPDQVGLTKEGSGMMKDGSGMTKTVIAGPDRQSRPRRYGVRPQWDVCFYLC